MRTLFPSCSPLRWRGLFIRIGIAGSLLLMMAPAQAVDYLFTGQAAAETPPRDGKNWFDPANWSPRGVPGPADTVIIPGSTVRLSADTTIANLALQSSTPSNISATLEGTGALTVTNTAEWQGGSFAGTLNIPQGATLTVRKSFTALQLDGREGAGILNNEGTLTVEPLAVIRGFGGQNTAILNSGTFIGQTQEGTGSGFLQWDPSGAENERPTLFLNTGTFRQTGPNSGSNAVNIMRWENRGTVEVHGGTLNLSGVQLENFGTLDVGERAFLDLWSDCGVQFRDGSLITGAGRFRSQSAPGPSTVDGTVTLGVAPVGDGPSKPGTFEIAGGETRGNLTLVTTPDGRAIWSGGVVSGTLNNPADSRLLLGEGEHIHNNLVLDSRQGAGILNIAGEAVLAPFALINGLSGGTPQINNSGTLELQVGDNVGRATIGTNRVDNSTGSLLLRNSGLIKNTGGNGENILSDLQIENTGTIQILNGSIGFRKDVMDHSGILSIAAGSFANFGDDTVVTLGGGNHLTGGGRARVDSVNATFNGMLNIGSAEDPTGTFELMGSAGLKGDLTLNAVGQGQAIWSGGTLFGALRVLSGTTLLIDATSPSGHVMDGSLGGALLDNAGTMILAEDATITGVFGNTEIRNNGTFELHVGNNTNRTSLNFNNAGGGAPLLLRNNGLLRNTGGNGSNLLFGMAFENPGIVRVENGGLAVSGGAFNHTGVIQAAEGAVFDFDNMTTFGEGARFVGGGRARVNGAPTLNGTLNLGSAEVPTGTFELMPNTTLMGNLTLAAVGSGGMLWTGGVLAGTLNLTPGTSLSIVSIGPSGHVMEGSAGGALLNTAGRVTLAPGAGITARLGATEIRNAGIFDVQTGSGSNFNFISNNNPAGENLLVFQNQPGGRFQKSGGTDVILLSGINFTNAGTFYIEQGEVDIHSGSFTQTSGGSLDLDLSGPTPLTEFGRLTVNGAASLGGVVHARLLNGYQPAEGTTFPVMSYNSRTGELSAELETMEGFTLEPRYEEKSLSVAVVKLPGDVNGDNTVNVNDAVVTLRVIVEIIGPTNNLQVLAMDTNLDGEVNVLDVIFMLRKAVGLP